MTLNRSLSVGKCLFSVYKLVALGG